MSCSTPASVATTTSRSPLDLVCADLQQRLEQPRRSSPVQHRQHAVHASGSIDSSDPPIDPARALQHQREVLRRLRAGELTVRRGRASTSTASSALRAVQTKDNISGFSVHPTASPTPVEPIGQPLYRLAAQREPEHSLLAGNGSCALRRPRPARGRLSSSSIRRSSLDSPTRTAIRRATNCARTGSGGNPFLKPLKSNNYRRQPGILFLAHRLRLGGACSAAT